MPKLDPDMLRRLCRARGLLRDDAGRALTVHEVADAVAISHFHFIRRFAQVFGVTPGHYRAGWRIERAKELLAVGEASVTDICFDVGFTSLGTFSALFRRRVGVSPSDYRRRARVFVQVPGVLPPELAPGCLSLMGRVTVDFRNSQEA